MKAVIASDIHGNLEYTQKLYTYCEKVNPDKIILLGDYLNNYYLDDYFAVQEIVNIMNRWSAITIGVRGNTDRLDDIEKLCFPIHDIYTEIDLDGTKYLITHGHYNNEMFEDKNVLMGHTHRYNLEGNHLNPGSVGLPRGNKEHTCLFYKNGTFSLINLDNFQIIAKKEQINKQN